MSSRVLLAQQQNPLLFSVATSTPIGVGDPFSLWSAEQIADATFAPIASVRNNWPLVFHALETAGVADPLVCQACLGTIAVETAHTFEPVREAYWLSETWRANNLRYYPYYGRGFVQLTWASNYEKYGNLIGLDLLGNPDWAMQPEVAAECMVQYFIRADVISAARAQDWAEVRRRVQGAYAGLDVLTAVVAALPITLFPVSFRGLAA